MVKDLRELRELSGWTQYDLAAATGIDRSLLSAYENQRVTPTQATRMNIEQKLLAAINRRREQIANALDGVVSV